MKTTTSLSTVCSCASRTLLSGIVFAGIVFAGGRAQAQTDTWQGASGSDWNTASNWSAGSIPATAGTAVFSSGGSGFPQTVTNVANQQVTNITFTGNAGNFTIGTTGGGQLQLQSGGTTQISSSLTSTNAIETLNAPIVLEGTGGTYTFANNSASGTGAGAGTLNIGGGITAGATSGTTVLTLIGNNTNANTISGVIGNGGGGATVAISKSGTGNWNLSGVNTYTGATTIGAGTLTISGAGDLGSGTYAGAIADSGTFNYNSSANQTLSGVISGSGGVVENGTGTLTLVGADTYTGGLTINAGTVVVANSGSVASGTNGENFMGTTGAITLGNATNTGQNATLEFNPTGSFNSTPVPNSITVTGNGIDTIETINHSPYFSGAVTLSNNLTILLNDASTAQMVFTTASSFTGTGNIITQVDSSGTPVPTGSYIGLNGSIGNTGMIINNGTGSDALLIGSGGATTIASSVTGIVEDSATSPIEFVGTATTINSTAATTIDAGTISLGVGALNSSSNLVFNGTGKLTAAVSQTVNGVTLNGGVGEVTETAANTLALGAITQGSTLGMVDVVDSGTQKVTTTSGGTNGIIAPWAFTGTGTTLAYAVSEPASGTATNITSYASATTATGSNVTSATTNYTLSTGTLTLANTSTAYTLQFTGTANALALSTFGLTLDGLMNTGSGTLTVSNGTGGTLTIGTTNVTNASQLDIIAGTNGITISAPIAGTGSLVYGVANGSTATLILSGANSYTGSTVVNSGTLQVQNAAALGQNTNSLNVESGATLDLDGTSGVFVGALNSTGLAGGTIEDSSATAATLTVGTGGGTGNFAGVIENNPGVVSLTKNGVGSQTLTGVNTYTGATTIGAGTLIIGGAGQLGSGTYAGAIADSGTFNYNSSAVQTLSGAITGTGALVQNGTGALTLTGANTYTGGTTVNSGLLTAITAATGGNESANLALPAGTITVASGGTINFVMANENNRNTATGYTFNIAGSGVNGAGALEVTTTGTVAADIQLSNVTLTANATLGTAGTSTAYQAGFHLGEQAGGTLNLNGHTLTITGTGATGGLVGTYAANYITDTVGGGSIVVNSGGNLAYTRSQNSPDTVTLNAGGSIVGINDNGGLNIAAPLTVNGGTIYGIFATTTFTNNVLLNNYLTLGTTYYGNTGTGTTFTGNLSGAGGLISGAGVTTLTGINSYTGNTAIGGGTLVISGAGDLGSGSYAGTIANNATFQYNSSVNQTLSGAISGSGVLVQNGSGTLTLTGANTYSGATTITGGTLVIGGSGDLGDNGSDTAGTYAPAISDSGAFVYNSSVNQTLSGAISGSGALGQNGASTLTLTAANTYTGNTTIGTGATLAIKGTTGDLGDTGTDVAGSYAGNIADNGTFNYNSSLNQTLGGTISGSGGLLENGSGALTLTNANTYSGSTTIAAGTLTLSGTGSINSSSGITINGSTAKFEQLSSVAGTRPITLTQGTLDGTGTVGAVTVANTTAAIITNGGGVGTGTLTVASLNFSGQSTLNLNLPGGASVSSVGIADLGNLTTLAGGSGDVTVNVTEASAWVIGDTYDLLSFSSYTGDSGTTDFHLGSVGGLGAREDATLGITGTSNGDLTLTITGDSPKWTGLSNGNWVVGPDGGSSHNWQLINAGTPTDYISGDTVLFDDSATGTTAINISAANVTPNGVTFNNSSLAYTVSSSGGFGIAGSTSLLKEGTANVTLSTANTYSGNTTISAGTLIISGTGDLGDNGSDTAGSYAANIANNGTFTYNSSVSQTLGGIISGSGVLVQDGTGLLTLTGANTYTGNTVIGANAALTVLGAGDLGSQNYTGNIADGGTFTYNSSVNQTLSGAISGAGVLVQNGTGKLTLAGANTYTGNTTIGAGTLVVGGTGYLGSQNYTGNIADGGTFTYNSSVNQTLSGAISGSGALVQNGTGKLSLAGANTYTGNTTIGANATLAILGTGDLGDTGTDTAGSYAGNIADSGTFNYNSSVNQTLSGAISGSGGLVENGTGTLTLTGDTNTYTGGTTVNGGVLTISAGTNGVSLTLPSGAVTIASGGTINLVMNGQTNRTLTSNFSIAGSGVGGVGALEVTTTSTSAASDVQIANITLAANATIGVTGTATPYQSGFHLGENGGTLNLNGHTLTITGSGATGGLVGLYATNYITDTAGGGSIVVNSGGNLAYTRSQNSNDMVTLNTGGSIVAIDDSGGTLVINAPLTVNGGTIYDIFNNPGQTTTFTNNVLLNNALTLANSYYGSTGTGMTFSGNLSGAGGLINNSGTNTLTGSNTYSGGTTVNGGTVVIAPTTGYSLTLPSGTVTVASGGTLDFIMANETDRNLASYTFNIAGSGANGAGALEGTTTNTAIGDVQIGNMTLTANATIATAGTSTNYNSGFHLGEAGGTLNLNGNTLTITGGGSTGGFVGVLGTNYITDTAGGGSIVVNSGGNLLFKQSQNSNDMITLNAGGSISDFNGDTVVAPLTINGGTIYSMEGTFTLSGNVLLNGTLTLANTYYGNTGTGTNLSGNLSGAGGLISSSGATTLTGANTYTGNTSIGANSTLAILGTGDLGDNGSDTAGSYAGTITNSGTFNYNSSVNQTLSGAISGAGELVENGPGVLTLTGDNTYTGNTSIGSNDALVIGASGILGSGNYSGTIADNGTFNYNSTAAQTLSGAISGSGSFQQNAGTLTVAGDNTYTGATMINSGANSFTLTGTLGGDAGLVGTAITNSAAFNESSSGVIAGNSSLTVTGGTTTLSGNNTFTGGTAISGNATVVIGTNNGALNSSTGYVTSGGVLSGSTGSLTVNGNGILDLEGTSQTVGALNGTSASAAIENQFSNGTDNANSALTINIASGSATYAGQINDYNSNIEGIQAGATSLVKTGLGTEILTGQSQYSGGTTINQGILEINSEDAIGNFDGYAYTDNGSATTYPGPNSGVAEVTLSGGELLTSQNASLEGSIALANGTTNTMAAVTGTTATYGDPNNETAITDGGPGSPGSLNIGDGTNDGTVTFTGNNNYNGTTTILSGATLRVNNNATAPNLISGSTSATGAGAVVVNSGGTLGGGNGAEFSGSTVSLASATSAVYAPGVVGNIAGGVTVNSGGTLAPGNSVGTITVGALTLSTGSILDYEFNSSANDFTSVTGALTISSGVDFYAYLENSAPTAYTFTAPGLYNLIGYGNVSSGDELAITADLSSWNFENFNGAPGLSYQFVNNVTGDMIQLDVTAPAVPEPGTWALMLSGLVILVVYQRRRANRS